MKSNKKIDWSKIPKGTKLKVIDSTTIGNGSICYFIGLSNAINSPEHICVEKNGEIYDGYFGFRFEIIDKLRRQKLNLP